MKGNIQAHAESDEPFPRMKSQQRAVVQQLMASSDPMIQEALADPSNIGFVKGLLGLSDLVVPGEDSRNKQLREIDILLSSVPIEKAPVAQTSVCGSSDGEGMAANSSAGAEDSANSAASSVGLMEGHRLKSVLLEPSVPIDLLFDNHVVELEECRRWANSDAGQIARVENPAGFANVRAHAEMHLRAVGLAYAASGKAAGPAASPFSGDANSQQGEEK